MNKFFLIFVLFFTSSIFSQNDSIVLKNNNKLVGEIKGLEKSILTFKTPYSDSDFKIKWQNVKEIYSPHLFIVALTNGDRFDASINTDSTNKEIVLLDAGGYVLESELDKILFLDAVGKNFLSRLSAEFDFGITLTKANSAKQFTANANAGYTANKWSLLGSFKSVLSSQEDTEDIKRIEGNLNFRWFLPKDWFLSTTASSLTNNEQKLKLRSTGKIGGGYYFKHISTMHFAGGGGLAYNNETYTDPLISDKNSLEGYFGIEFNKYDIGDLSIYTSAFGYPSLTEKGRFRTDIKFDMKYDLPLDFFVKMSATYNFDNQPVEGATRGDYVFQTTVGWELK